MSTMSEKVSLIASDGKIFTVDKAVAMVSNKLKSICGDSNHSVSIQTGEIPLDFIPAETLEKILVYCNKQIEFGNNKEKLKQWCVEFLIAMDSKATTEMAKALNYLDIPYFYRLLCRYGLKRFYNFDTLYEDGAKRGILEYEDTQYRNKDKRKKMEEYTDNYLQLLKATEGFYAGHVPFHLLCPIDGGVYPCGLECEDAIKAAKFALEGLELPFVKLLRANASMCQAADYYLTMETSNSRYIEAKVREYEGTFKLCFIRPAKHYPNIDDSLHHLEDYDQAYEIDDSDDGIIYDDDYNWFICAGEYDGLSDDEYDAFICDDE